MTKKDPADTTKALESLRLILNEAEFIEGEVLLSSDRWIEMSKIIHIIEDDVHGCRRFWESRGATDGLKN